MDPRDAVIITNPDTIPSASSNKSVDELGEMLNHLAISTGYAIKNYAVDDREIVIRKLVKVIKDTIK